MFALMTGVAAAGTITQPTGSPFVVPGDAAGNAQSFTITGSGWNPGGLVWLEQCDGVAPTTPGWRVTINCDLGSAPAAAVAASDGTVTFAVTDANHAFHPFKGESPQTLFNCLSPNDPPLDPTNGLTDFRNCKIRMSSNNSIATADQTFLDIQLPDAPVVSGGTQVGACGGQVGLITFYDSTGAVLKPLTDVTAIGTTAKSKLLKDITTKTAIGGDCSSAV